MPVSSRVSRTAVCARSHQGIPAPERSSRMDEFLTYWLAAYVADLRPTTARGYESAVRLHLIPGLGRKRLDKLTVQDVRAFITACRQKCLCCAGKVDQHRSGELPPGPGHLNLGS
ncbi:hypothetical protein DKL51_20705 [Micromonospora globispora]|nr:hypothetical protein DKL51_20705 [Micromonospora globispora]